MRHDNQQYMIFIFVQGGETAVKLLKNEEDKITLLNAVDEYNNSFLLK